MTYVRVKQLSARPAGKLGGTTDIMLRPCADGAFLFYMKGGEKNKYFQKII